MNWHFAEADAAASAWLAAELACRVSTRVWGGNGVVSPADLTLDEDHLGMYAFAIPTRIEQLEIQLWDSFVRALDRQLAGVSPIASGGLDWDAAMPTARVHDFVRRFATCWLAAAAPKLALGPSTWRTQSEPRGFTATSRGCTFDLILSQLLGAPVGELVLVTPA